MFGETGLLLVQVDHDQLKADGRTGLQLLQDVEHAVAVFSYWHTRRDRVLSDQLYYTYSTA